jgi:AMP-binding enzyme
MAEVFGKGLRSQYDWQKGDVLAISSASDIDMPPIIFGALWAGATVSTTNPGYTFTELSHQLRDSGAKPSSPTTPISRLSGRHAEPLVFQKTISLSWGTGGTRLAASSTGQTSATLPIPHGLQRVKLIPRTTLRFWSIRLVRLASQRALSSLIITSPQISSNCKLPKITISPGTAAELLTAFLCQNRGQVAIKSSPVCHFSTSTV